jgi:hypothetical protein
MHNKSTDDRRVVFTRVAADAPAVADTLTRRAATTIDPGNAQAEMREAIRLDNEKRIRDPRRWLR